MEREEFSGGIPVFIKGKYYKVVKKHTIKSKYILLNENNHYHTIGDIWICYFSSLKDVLKKL